MTTVEARTVEQALAGVKAGHIMAGMPLTDTAEAMVRRIAAGESTVEQEVDAARRRALARMDRQPRKTA
ncbi:hypothetical protein [Tsukamurella sp. NPDC003166]|uniref:hypothetical protein n=1 Tax=Tsukamurella sp. NPDC003166 TaxID=3154444 RepID=UPI0033B6E787